MSGRGWIAVLLLLSVIAGLQAQENAEGQAFYGVITVSAEAGTLEEQGDGTYLLTLEDVYDEAPYWMAAPAYMPLPVELIGTTAVSDAGRTGLLLLASTINAWRLDETLTAEAWLSTGAGLVQMRIRQPDYFPNEDLLIFEAEILEILGGVEGKSGVVAPEKFLFAALAITFDDALVMGLDLGFADAIANVRWNCSGTERQREICRCKRDVDEEMLSDRTERAARYLECNAIVVEEKQ